MKTQYSLLVVGICLSSFFGPGAVVAGPEDDLTAASEKGDFENVKKLVESGADPSKRDSVGWYSLQKAASGGHVRVMAFLVENGAGVDAVTARENTALISAAAAGQFEAVMWLLKKGVDVHHTNQKGQSARYFAERGKHEEVSELREEAERTRPRNPKSNPTGIKKLAPFEVPTLNR